MMKLKKLTQIEKDETCYIVSIDPSIANIICSVGFTVGRELKVDQKTTNDLMIVSVLDTKMVIDKHISKKILVTTEKENTNE